MSLSDNIKIVARVDKCRKARDSFMNQVLKHTEKKLPASNFADNRLNEREQTGAILPFARPWKARAIIDVYLLFRCPNQVPANSYKLVIIYSLRLRSIG